jgi:hypothetical protein
VNGSLPPTATANDVTAKADGTTTNGDLFRIRRARFKAIIAVTDYMKAVFEVDPFPNGGFQGAGTGTIARNVEAIGIAKWSNDVQTEYGVGMFKPPFGSEVLQSDADRPFIERSWWENNLFPGEYDTGARAYTSALRNKLSVQVAVVNGVVLGEKNFTVVPDLGKGKDFLGRVNFNFGPLELGVSADVGQAQIVDTKRLAFATLPRWGANFSGVLHHTLLKAVGETRAMAELTLAKNLDRGVRYPFALGPIPTDVTASVPDHDERGLMVRVEQDLSAWLTLGLRYDMYTPDSAQKNDARDTYGAVLVTHFTKGLQLMTEYDHSIDNVHAPGDPAPSKQLEMLSAVLQARW